jgi:hypothetical protein
LGLFLLSGCVGQTYEGAWRGPFPLAEASDCRVRLTNDRRFDLGCVGSGWVGTGRWEPTASGLRFDFALLGRDGRRRKPPTLELRVVGRGNRLDVPGGVWRRMPL